MYERQLWEVPRFLSTEEVAELTGMTIHAVKCNGTRQGWAYGMGRDGVKYWDVSSFSFGMPEKLFDGFLRHDTALKPLEEVAREDVLCFVSSIERIRINMDYMPYYVEAALMCRILEIIQDATVFMPGLHIPYACTGFYFKTGVSSETLEAMSAGQEFTRPLFSVHRRFWFSMLTEWVRRVRLYGEDGTGNHVKRVKSHRPEKSLRHLKPAVALAQ